MDSDEDKQYAEQKANEFIENLNKSIENAATKYGISESALSGWT